MSLLTPKLTPLFLVRATSILISLWYCIQGTSSYALLILVTVTTIILSNILLSRNSTKTALFIDSYLNTWTYPQDLLRNLFVIRDFRPFPENLNYSVVSRPIYLLLDNVVDKFILSWHSGITRSKNFPRLVRQELVDMVHRGYSRCGLLNKYTLVQYVLEMYLVRVQEAASDTSPALSQIQHSAALTQQAEDQYVRAVCDLLMRVLLSKVHYECEALRAALREILSTQLLTTLVDMVSDPEFLLRSIVEIIESDDDEEFSSISDDDKEFLKNKPSDKKCVEIDLDEHEPDLLQSSTTIQFAALNCSPGERSNKFRIPKVRLFGEGITRFAVYVIEYSDKLWNSDGPEDDISIHLVGRRFKEFAALHERLIKDKTTKQPAKKINFPSKEPLSSFPFNRLDREFLSSRRDLFTQYLNEICQHDEILQSDDVKEFLGYNREEITVFRTKSSSFIESKIGQNISRMFKNFTQSLSLSNTKSENPDDSFLDINSEMYASYRESVQRTKKLTALSRDHAKFLKAPPSSDICDILNRHIKEKLDLGEKGAVVPSPTGYYTPSCVSIRDSRFSFTILHAIQQAFSHSGTILGCPGTAQLLTTILRLPLNRYFINKINLLTSENYWFVYLTKLNQVLFETPSPQEEGAPVTKAEFVRRTVVSLGKEKVLSVFGHDKALELVAETLSSKTVNKMMLFLIVDHFLAMFVPELEDELKSLYK